MSPGARRGRPQPGSLVVGCEIVGAAAGLVLVAVGSWRPGAGLIGGVLVFGSLARALLPERRAGLLRTRRPLSDVVIMSGFGLVIVALAVLVPERPVP